MPHDIDEVIGIILEYPLITVEGILPQSYCIFTTGEVFMWVSITGIDYVKFYRVHNESVEIINTIIILKDEFGISFRVQCLHYGEEVN